MKKKLIGLIVVMVLLGIIGMAQAALTVIGTATYNGNDYNLIWDDDNNNNSVVWLDYSNTGATWQNQKDWTAGLDTDGVGGTEGQLAITWNPGISVTWNDAAWRLPSTVDGLAEQSCDGTDTSPTATSGYYFTNSEMGHLYYTELGNLGYEHMSGGSCQSDPGYGLQNTGDFDNLFAAWYWSGTEYATTSDYVWIFGLISGGQFSYSDIGAGVGYGLALRSGQVVSDSIPTLSEWGQILLVVMLGVSALWIHRRRSMMV